MGDNFNVRQLMLRAVHPQVLELPYNSREEDLRGLPEQPLSRSAKKLRLRKKQGQKRGLTTAGGTPRMPPARKVPLPSPATFPQCRLSPCL